MTGTWLGRARAWTFAVVGVLSACDPVQKTCEDFCFELVITCDVAAYPDLTSCQQGCLYEATTKGLEVVQEQERCTREASCDMFALVECQHEADLATSTVP